MDEVIYKKFNHKHKRKNKLKKSLGIHKNKSKNKRKSVNLVKEKNIKNFNLINNSGRIPLKRNTISNTYMINQQNYITQAFQTGEQQKTKSHKSKLKPDTDYELNWLTYKEAIKYDKRSNCDYYGSLL